MFLRPVIYFGRAFPNWRARVIPAIVISGFLAFVSKNPICFSDGSMSCGLILLITMSNWFSCGGGNRTLDL